MIQLNYQDARPIYEQIKDGLRHLMVTRALRARDKLPSVRALASSLAINPNTVQRVYESLKQEGYPCTMMGKGSFAALQANVNAARRDRLLRGFDASAAEFLFLGITAGELARRLETVTRQAVGEECGYD